MGTLQISWSTKAKQTRELVKINDLWAWRLPVRGRLSLAKQQTSWGESWFGRQAKSPGRVVLTYSTDCCETGPPQKADFWKHALCGHGAGSTQQSIENVVCVYGWWLWGTWTGLQEDLWGGGILGFQTSSIGFYWQRTFKVIVTRTSILLPGSLRFFWEMICIGLGLEHRKRRDCTRPTSTILQIVPVNPTQAEPLVGALGLYSQLRIEGSGGWGGGRVKLSSPSWC